MQAKSPTQISDFYKYTNHLPFFAWVSISDVCRLEDQPTAKAAILNGTAENSQARLGGWELLICQAWIMTGAKMKQNMGNWQE
jgi:hypothetical protein